MSFFVNYIKVPFVTAVNTFGLSDNFSYSVSLTGYYSLIPEASDAFDSYATGGGQFTKIFFSGSGNWNGSGYTFSNNNYFYDTFDDYGTGSGILYLVAGQTVSGYSLFNNLQAGFILSSGEQQAIILSFYDLFENYQTGLVSGYGNGGASGGALTGFTLKSGTTTVPQSGYFGYSVWSGYYN